MTARPQRTHVLLRPSNLPNRDVDESNSVLAGKVMTLPSSREHATLPPFRLRQYGIRADQGFSPKRID
jgi:3-isopropylmalate dehydratase small subunit